MEQALKIAILAFAVVDLAIIALVGLVVVYRLLPPDVRAPRQVRKQSRNEENVKEERSRVGSISE